MSEENSNPELEEQFKAMQAATNSPDLDDTVDFKVSPKGLINNPELHGATILEKESPLPCDSTLSPPKNWRRTTASILFTDLPALASGYCMMLQ